MFCKIFLLLLSIGAINCLPSLEGRIVGGRDAKIGEFPYIVSLRKDGRHACAGSILNDEWILTAAHCVDLSSASMLSIQYGVNRISPNGKNVMNVKKIVLHKNYNHIKDHINDIALLQLESKIEFSDLVKPIELPTQKQEFEHGTIAVLAGWGYEKTHGSTQENLKKVVLKTFSDAECTRRHKGRTGPSHLCGGLPEGGKGQCTEDNGGPLTVKGVQVGIVSWSIKPCTVYPFPGVYTKVSHFVDWINENMK